MTRLRMALATLAGLVVGGCAAGGGLDLWAPPADVKAFVILGVGTTNTETAPWIYWGKVDPETGEFVEPDKLNSRFSNHPHLKITGGVGGRCSDLQSLWRDKREIELFCSTKETGAYFYVQDIAAGTYRLASVAHSYRHYNVQINQLIRFADPDMPEFTMTPGEAVYLGDFLFAAGERSMRLVRYANNEDRAREAVGYIESVTAPLVYRRPKHMERFAGD